MSKTNYKPQTPWQDRWKQPTVEQLLEPIKESHRKAFDSIMEGMESYEGITRDVVWSGEGWQWTIEYILDGHHTTGPEDPDAMAYIIPDPEQPVLAIPLRDKHFEQIPLRRVNRFIRDQLRSAKCPVEIHWGKWTPSAQTEVDHIMDLFKRKWKIMTGKKR